jgi:hypothetical protein
VENAADAKKPKMFELYNDGIPTVEELFNVRQEKLNLVGAEVFDRLFPLTAEMLDRISP